MLNLSLSNWVELVLYYTSRVNYYNVDLPIVIMKNVDDEYKNNLNYKETAPLLLRIERKRYL
jgi:hypothetical protein